MSYEDRTLVDQRVALSTLARVGAAFGHLPAPELSISRITPSQVDISLHDDFADFEQWRVALGIAPETVLCRTQPGATSLKAIVSWGDGVVALTGFGPLPLRDVERGEPT